MTAPTPAVPGFIDGIGVTAQDLNDLVENMRDLYTQTLGGFRTKLPLCQVRMSTAQTVASGADVLLSFGVESYDTDGMFAPTSSIITIQTTGWYRVGFHAHLAAVTAATNAQQTVRVTRNSTNPTTGAVAACTAPLSSGSGSSAACSTLVRLTAGDVLRCYVRQNSGNSTSILLTYGGARAFVYWVAP